MNSGNEFWDQNDSQELEQDASDFDDARPLFSGLSNMQLPGVNVPGITQGAGLLGMSEDDGFLDINSGGERRWHGNASMDELREAGFDANVDADAKHLMTALFAGHEVVLPRDSALGLGIDDPIPELNAHVGHPLRAVELDVQKPDNPMLQLVDTADPHVLPISVPLDRFLNSSDRAGVSFASRDHSDDPLSGPAGEQADLAETLDVGIEWVKAHLPEVASVMAGFISGGLVGEMSDNHFAAALGHVVAEKAVQHGLEDSPPAGSERDASAFGMRWSSDEEKDDYLDRL